MDLSADKIVGQYLLELESRHSGDSSVFDPEAQTRRADGDSIISKEHKRFWTSQNDVFIRLANSENLWERRIAIIATFQFIKKRKEYDWTFRIAEILLSDNHDLIHKAVGWMLREVGKRCSQEVLEAFLKKHYRHMPRIMLRYAIERLPENIRKSYLNVA